MTADLDFTGQSCFIPIGKMITSGVTSSFNGTFDGNGYMISGLTINNVEKGDHDTMHYRNSGLFGIVDGGTIKNVTICDSNITGRVWVGAVAGYCSDSVISGCTVLDTVIVGDNSVENQSAIYVGGIVGQMYDSEIEGSLISSAEITVCDVYKGSSLYVGGLFGALSFSGSDGYFETDGACFDGTIFIDVSVSVAKAEIGGIIGSDFDSSTVQTSVVNKCSNGG